MATDKLSVSFAEATELMLQTEEAYPVVKVTIVNAQGGGKRLNCYHRRFQRTLHAGCRKELDSIFATWGLKEIPARLAEKVRHLVDGIPMTILLCKDGVWRARYTRDGKTHKKYFGKVDPRDRYPLAREGVLV